MELYNICEEELYSLTDETREGSRLSWQNVPARKAPNFANLHFKAMLELISALYEPNTAQLKQYSREFTDPNCVSIIHSIDTSTRVDPTPITSTLPIHAYMLVSFKN